MLFFAKKGNITRNTEYKTYKRCTIHSIAKENPVYPRKSTNILDTLEGFRKNPNPYAAVALIKAYNQTRAPFEKVQEIFDTLANIERPNIFVFNSMLSACRNSKRYETGWQYFDKMKKYNVLPDEITFQVS
jgi:pentatricopeptide repeat protein